VTRDDQVVSRSEGIGERDELLAAEKGAGRRAPVGSWLGLGAGIAAVLAPKCPLCLAAYFSMVGIGVGLAKVAPMLFPLGVVVASIAFISLLRSRGESTDVERKGR